MQQENLNENSLTQKSVSITNRVNAMKILLYIARDIDKLEVYCLKEIAEALDMYESTVHANLQKLVEAGILEKTEPLTNRKEKYYSIANKTLAENAIKKYKRAVAFSLARLIPYQKQYVSQLSNDRRFIEACQKYGVTIEEAVTMVLSCYKISTATIGHDILLWRREQGYKAEQKKENCLKPSMMLLGFK